MANTVIKFYNEQEPEKTQKIQRSSEIYVDVSLASRYGAMTQHLGKNKGVVPYQLKVSQLAFRSMSMQYYCLT